MRFFAVRTPLLAALAGILLVPTLAASPASALEYTPLSLPGATGTQSLPFAASAAGAREIDALAPGSPATVTDVFPLDPSTPYVVGITWTGGFDGEFDARVMYGDVWDPWTHVGLEDAPDGETEAKNGTEPLVVGSGYAVQLRVTHEQALPADLELHIITATAPDAVVPAGILPLLSHRGFSVPTAGPLAAEQVENPSPVVNSRATWGAIPPSDLFDEATVLGAVVHHTAGINNYTPDEVPGLILAIQELHMEGREFFDIGYNFLIDKYGNVWEGREGGTTIAVRGAHGHSYNAVGTGISVMGDYEQVDVPQVVKNSLVNVIAWKLTVHGIDATGVVMHQDELYPTIIGHKDIHESSTACPGYYLYRWLPTLRTLVAKRQHLIATAISADATGDGWHDLAVVEGDRVTVYQQAGATSGASHPFEGALPTGITIGASELMAAGPSLALPKQTDLVVRSEPGSPVELLRTNDDGTASPVDPYKWSQYQLRDLFLPGDVTGDGNNDVVRLHGSGVGLYYVTQNAAGGTSAPLAAPWSTLSATTLVGDITGDGFVDVLGVDSETGALMLARGTANGAPGLPQVIVQSLPGITDIAAAGDVTFDGVDDALLHNGVTGATYTLPGTTDGAVGELIEWGGGWGTWRDPVGVLNWRGTAGTTLLAVDTNTGELVQPQLTAKAADGVSYVSAERSVTLPGLADAFIVGDVNGDGRGDLALVTKAGFLYLANANARGFDVPTLVSGGWGQFSHIAPAGDMSFDGVPDIVSVSYEDGIFITSLSAEGSATLTQQVVYGYTGVRAFGIGAWLPGSKGDILVIDDETGVAKVLRGHGMGGLTNPKQIATDWSDVAVVAAGNPSYADSTTVLIQDPSTSIVTAHSVAGNGAIGTSLEITVELPSGAELNGAAPDVQTNEYSLDMNAVPMLQLDGHGRGTGIGLSRSGAKLHADSGHTATEILDTYYPGSVAHTVPAGIIRVLLIDEDVTPAVLAEQGLTVATEDTSLTLPANVNGSVEAWRAVNDGGLLSLEYRVDGNWAALGTGAGGLDLATQRELTFGTPSQTIEIVTDAGSRQYAGSLVMRRNGEDGLDLIIHSNLEDYVAAVVAQEMPAWWPSAALEAQAISVRTSAVKNFYGGSGGSRYDTCSGGNCREFMGIADYDAEGFPADLHVTEAVKNAVAATASQARFYGLQPISTPWTETNGGYAVAGTAPYLVSGYDKYDVDVPWQRTLSRAKIETVFPELGSLTSLDFVYDGNGEDRGRIVNVSMVGSDETVTLGGMGFAAAFGLPSSYVALTPLASDYVATRSRDVTTDGASDLLAVNTEGSLLTYTGTIEDGFVLTSTSPSHLNLHDPLALVSGLVPGDALGLVGVTQGTLNYHRLSALGEVGDDVALPGEWSDYPAMTGLDGWNGEGTTALVSRAPNGETLLFPGTPSGVFTRARVITDAWKDAESVLPAGDVNGDGLADLYTYSRKDGTLTLHLGLGAGMFNVEGTLAATGLGEAGQFVTAGDWNGDGRFDVMVFNAEAGVLEFMAGKPNGTLANRIVAGDGFTDVAFLN